MEAILELVLTILFAPFESKFENLWNRIGGIPNKAVRILLMMLLVILPFAIVFGLCVLVICLIRLIRK